MQTLGFGRQRALPGAGRAAAAVLGRAGRARQAAAVRSDRFPGVFTQVVPQMPAISDLDRVRRPGAGTVNGTVGYQKCLNAVAWSVVCRVAAWLIVVSSWSVRSSRLLART